MDGGSGRDNVFSDMFFSLGGNHFWTGSRLWELIYICSVFEAHMFQRLALF